MSESQIDKNPAIAEQLNIASEEKTKAAEFAVSEPISGVPGSTISGAAGGALIGSMLGPIGTIAGAVIGASYGGLIAAKAAKAAMAVAVALQELQENASGKTKEPAPESSVTSDKKEEETI